MPENMLRREAAITGSDVATRSLTVQLLGWDDPRTVVDPGRAPYIERWARDALTPRERLYVLDRHGGDLIGRMGPPEDAGPGPTAELTIADTAAGRDLLALVDAGVVESVSIEAIADPAGEVWSADRREVTRTRAELCGVAFSFHPAHHAPILAREHQENPMTDIIEAEIVSDTPAPPPVVSAGVDAVQAETVELRRQVGQLVARMPATAAKPRFASLGELILASARDINRELPRDLVMESGGVPIHRALADVTSADVPGIMHPQQINELYSVIDANQPLVEAAGKAPAPTAMAYVYPSVTQRPLIGPQTAEKTEIVSRDTKIIDVTVPVQTLAGGEDVSVQVLQLSTPAYAQIRGQLYAEEMARATDVAAYTAYVAANSLNATIGTDPKLWVTKLFELAGQVLSNSRRFPNRLVLSPDLWVKIGGAVDGDGRPIFTGTNGTNNAGTATLTSPEGDIRGLTYVVDPHLPADRGLMFPSSAFLAGLGPVQTMTVDVPRLLGQDYAMFRFGAFLSVAPNGMALFASGVAPTADEETSSGKVSRSKAKS